MTDLIKNLSKSTEKAKPLADIIDNNQNNALTMEINELYKYLGLDPNKKFPVQNKINTGNLNKKTIKFL